MNDPPKDDRPSVARCLIVDDEAPAREELRFLLQGLSDRVRVLGEATNATEAIELLRSIDYDIVLLDIRMPGGSGMDVARQINSASPPPAVIFVTAYDDHAVDAFELRAVDYLLKPIDSERLEVAVDRALAVVGAGADSLARGGDPPSRPGDESGSTRPTIDRIPVQQGDRTVLVSTTDIIVATAVRGYSYLSLPDQRYLVTYSLTELEDRLGPSFFRAHRSHLVNLAHVAELVGDDRGSLVLVMDDQPHREVEVSRRQAGALRRALGM